MNNIQIFRNEQFGAVRTVQQEENILFIAVDVCKALEIKNSRDAISRLDDDEKADVGLTDGSQKRYYKVVNEYGLYNLVLSSRKPEAKAFKRWITHEVIPAIRKTGRYEAQKAEPVLIKYYNGLRVVTKQDLIHLLKITRSCLSRCIYHPYLMEQGKDYFILNEKELFKFRTKYKLKAISRLTLITASGVEKILEAQRIDVPITTVFPIDENYKSDKQVQETPQQQSLLPLPPQVQIVCPSKDRRFMELYNKAKGLMSVLDEVVPLCRINMEAAEHAGVMTSAFIASCKLTKAIQDMQYIKLR